MIEEKDESLDNSETADSENAKFWNYLCGTNAATYMGFELDTKNGLAEFDTWYMDFYPYLLPYIDSAIAEGHSCLEVGIGLGTVSRYLARNMQEFSALDVAPEPCIFLEKSLSMENVSLITMRRSILEGPVSTELDARYDVAIAIGSLHHSGNLTLALDNLVKSVKPGGKILVMVYNEFSLYRLIHNPIRFLNHLILSMLKKKYSWSEQDKAVRAVNDSNEHGVAAPHTAYSSKQLFHSRIDSTWTVNTENISDLPRLGLRNKLLPFVRNGGGLDLYALGVKCADRV
jgi:2-polyprenyl-3-methyl-5-hydroxy-6-metoxy-1,4-benzoquinol methylase